MSKSLRICFLSAEVAPYAKVGGLADVAGALPKAIRELGHEILLVLPKYATVEKAGLPLEKVAMAPISVEVGAETLPLGVWRGTLPGSAVPIYFLDNPDLFGGGVYADPDAGSPHTDNTRRFVAFSLGSLELLRALGWRPDVFHLNDNHVALIPLYLKHRYTEDEVLGGAATLITIHNLAYQGTCPKENLALMGLPEELAYPGSSLEFYGQLNPLKAGLVESDLINTVSETYAEEIQTEAFGAGLDPVLRSRRATLHGILNGADYSVWDPRVDRLIPHTYGPDRMEGKRKNKTALLKKLGLPSRASVKIPVIGLISRLVEQKGFDIIEPALPDLMAMNLQMVMLGTGEEKYHRVVTEMAERHPKKLAVRLAFDNELAHLIEAGSDMFLMPSRFEPSGLNQIYSLRYGTVPIVRATGGLADTVVDDGAKRGSGTGFVFREYKPAALVDAVRRAVDTYGDRRAWTALVQRGMEKDFSWGTSAKKYAALYLEAMGLARERTRSASSVR